MSYLKLNHTNNPTQMKYFTKRYLGIVALLFASLFTLKLSAQDTEPNNTIATTQQFLSPNSAISGGLVLGVDQDDFFGLLPGDDGNISITANFGVGLTARLRLQYKNGTQLALTSPSTGENIATASCLANDTIYAWVEHQGGGGSYTLLFEVDTPPTHAQDLEPNNNIATAKVFMTPNQTVEGRMGYNGFGISDLDDFYGLLPGEDGNISITANFDATMTGRLRLQYKNGTQLALTSPSTGENIATASCLANDTIYAWVEHQGGCGSYTLLFEVDTPPTFAQDEEINNSIAEAKVFMTPDQTVEGRMGYNGFGISDFDDFYGLLPGEDGNISITANFDATLTGRLRLQYKNGTQLALTSPSTGENIATASCLANDTIYAWVEHQGGCGSYTLLFEVDTPPTFAQDEEINNSIAEAKVFMTPDQTVEGRMGYNGFGISDLDDFYGLLPGDDGNISITANFDATMTGRLRLQYKNGTQLDLTSPSTGENIATASCVASDTIYAWVEHQGGCGSYTLLFETAASTFANDSEPNNILAESIPIQTAEKVQGRLGYNGFGISDLDDYYSFEVIEAPFDMDAKVTLQEGLTMRMRLYSSTGTQLVITSNSSVDFNMISVIADPGTYHIQMEHIGGCGSYQLGDICGQYPTVTATPAGPLNKCPGESVALSASSGLAAYTWLSSGTPIASSQAYAPSTPGSYQVVGYDINGCPDTTAVIIVTDLDCNDNDPCTDDSCVSGSCVNTYSGDADNDGTCNNLDLCPNDPAKIAPGNCGCGNPEPGAICDDGDFTTIDDLITTECVCLGTKIDCPGDITGDLIVDINDFIALNSAFGSACSGCPEDLNNSGAVDINDFIILNSNYGNNCNILVTGIQSENDTQSGLREDINRLSTTDIHSELAKKIEELSSFLDFDILPNPNNGEHFELRLNTGHAAHQSVTVELLDITGKRVIYTDISLKKGSSILPIETGQFLESGIYLVKLTMGSSVYTKRMSVR